MTASKSQEIPVDINTKYIYLPDVGIFVWGSQKKHGSKNEMTEYGELAGAKDPVGYISLKYGRVRYKAHRIAWYLCTGEWLSHDVFIDHINGDKHDNRITNLRKVTKSENNKNSKPRKDNRYGYKGVYLVTNSTKWAAHIRINGKPKHLGCFATVEEAYQARQNAEKVHYGEYSFFARETS